MTDPVYAWYFSRDDGRSSARGVPIETHMHVDPPLVLCAHGLHASASVRDALAHAKGARLHLVRLFGEILRGDDKVCATDREVIAVADITTLLHLWACDVAEAAVYAYCQPPDPRSLTAIETKRRWVRGEATTEELHAASAAARDAAWDAARDTAWDAARDTASAAARDAARGAAWGAAWDAAWAAASGAASGAQNADLTARVLALPEFAPHAHRVLS